MAKYGNILLVKNPSNERVKPVTDFLDANKLRYVYRSQVLFYEATKMSQLDEVEKIAAADGLEFVHIHSHTLPGNFVSSNFLAGDTLEGLKKVWTPD